MATQASRATARLMLSPAVILLLIWMIVPLAMTIYFSTLRYRLTNPLRPFVGWTNYEFFVSDAAFWQAIGNTLVIVGLVLLVTVVLGILLALLLNQPIFGQGFVRVLVIAPFLIMPTVSALIWKNMMLNPVNGVFAWVAQVLGLEPYDFFGQAPLLSVTGIVAWQWLPFATLIFLTALQSLDSERMEAAEMDGAGPVSRFRFIVLPHLARAITVVILIQTIFLLSVFAEIRVTTNGGPGTASTNLTFLVYARAFLGQDIGGGAAGGIIAVILANIVAIFLMRAIGKNLDA